MAGCDISHFEFTQEEIQEAVNNQRLLSMEIEFTLKCNYRCPYCYVPENSYLKNELTREEICDVILQAKELGAKKIILLGGEPMIYPYFFEMVEYIHSLGLMMELFTNNSQMTPEKAKKLLDYGVNVVVKVNSFDKETQEMLTGIKGSFEEIKKGLSILKEAGYPSEKAILAVSTVICPQNYEELPKLWRWLRDQHIEPYFEIITPQGKAMDTEWAVMDPGKLKSLFEGIAEIDQKEYGKTWTPQPPLVGGKCLRHAFSCLVNSQGFVMPCVGVTIPVGNIRERKLQEIIKDSEVIQDLRHFRDNIKDPCRSCEEAENCYGCRGAAYQLTGDYLASDPICWKNQECKDEIISLPMSTEKILPQNGSMRIVDNLLKIGERTAEVSAVVREGTPFVGEDGVLDESVYVELLAQAIASFQGFKQLGTARSKMEGFLLGAKKIEILGQAKVGDELKISVFKYEKFGDFGLVKGTVARNGDILARGEIKIWHKTSE